MSIDARASAQVDLGSGSVRSSTQVRTAPGGAPARAANPPARTASPKDASVGKWEVTAKDGKGVSWKGTLTVGDLDPEQFSPDPSRNHLCDLTLESPEGGGRGRQTPCFFNAQTRTLTFGADSKYDKFSYKAVLSPDGKSFLQGSWTEEDSGTGTWSARMAGAAAAPGRK